MLISQVLSKLAAFGGVILLARYLDVADFGTYALAIAVIGIISLVNELGFNQLSVREIARDHDTVAAYVTNTILVKLVLASLALLAAAGLFTFTGMAPDSRSIILVFIVALIPLGAFHSLVAVMQGVERMGYLALVSFLSEAVRLALAAGVLIAGYRLVPLAWSYAASCVISLVIAWVMLRRLGCRLTAVPSWSLMRTMIAQSLPFLFYGAFFFIYFKIDLIMLAAMKSDEDVGTYAAAFRLMESLMFIPAAIMGAVFPGLARITVASRGSLLSASRRTLRYMAMIGIPVGFGTAVLAGRIVPFLFGDAYLASVLPLQILIWSLVLTFLSCICPVSLTSINRQSLNVVVTGSGIAVNVGLNLFLIPRYSAIGASIATVLTELVAGALYLWFFKRHIGSLGLVRLAVRPVAAAAVMTTVLLALPFLPLGMLVVLGAAIYTAMLFITRALGRTDLEFLARLLKPALAEREA
jgi:O-antigen/teichoic acid export membrane protein